MTSDSTVSEQHYKTTEVSSTEKRAERWREFISEVFVELDCDGMSSVDFFGELTARQLGDFGISHITTDGYDVFRTRDGIAKSSFDDFLVSVQTKGSSVIRQLGREAVLNPGDFTIYDSTIPYHLHFEDRLSKLVIQIPRHVMKEQFSVPETLTAVRYDGSSGIARIMTNFAQTAFAESNVLDDDMQKQVARTLVEFLATSIRTSNSVPVRETMNRTTKLIRIKSFISEQLRDGRLSPKMIAANSGISVRYLEMLFEEEPLTPARYIWNQRLIKASRDLKNPNMAHRSISEICHGWAFADPAHFSRAFKIKFGMSPRAFRRAATGQ